MILSEDTPINYIDQLIKQVLRFLATEQQSKNKISFINFNSKRKNIDSSRVDKNGKYLTPEEFKNQALEYFDKNYKAYSKYKQIVLDALNDYSIIEEQYFNE